MRKYNERKVKWVLGISVNTWDNTEEIEGENFYFLIFEFFKLVLL